MKYFKMYVTIGFLLMLTLTASAKTTKTNHGQEKSKEVHERNAERYIEKHNLSDFDVYKDDDVIEIYGYLKDIEEVISDLDISKSEREAILNKIEKIEEVLDLEEDDKDQDEEDEDKEDEVPEFIQGKAIIIPSNMIVDGMGLDLYYDGDNEVIITDGDTWMEFDTDHLVVIVNDKVHLLDPEEVPYAPLEFIAEQFDLYDGDNE
ncbi:hypothetical protein [Vallitalea okinawensis]|uniref:hypothetical protein n=1 Tax=Vallitalea okinawensis TaxID=2078660 RepID=UPI000CFC2F05|nr:hypothetical protein [Vallitalea okinawensis]